MPFRLRKRETVSEGCRRILLEQGASMISALSDRGGVLDDRIHDVRKRLKRVRALIRLVELKLDAQHVELLDDVLHDVGRRLAPARDASVILAAFEEISAEFTGGAIERIRELLTDSQRVAKRRALGPDKLAKLAAEIRKACDTLSRAGTKDDGWPAVAAGIYESYRAARKQRREAFAEPTADQLHELRRKTKQLWEQLRVLRGALPKSIHRQLSRLEKLAELLGRHHDLHVLQTTLLEASAHGLEVAKFPPLHKLIRGKMGKHLKHARKLSAEIYSTRPKAFNSHLHAGWKDWLGKKKGK
jgi:CHAD domain-containing protein